jgi:acyl carrier protein
MDYLSELQKIIARKFSKIDPSTITLQTQLLNDLKLDSLDIVELVVDIEDVFGVELYEENLINVKTIEDLINEIKS